MAYPRGVLDESKPTCKRCGKAGYTCAGYERKLELRFHSFSNEAEQQTTTGLSRTTKEPPSSSQQRIPTSLILSSNDDSQDFVPPDMSLVAFREDIQFAYLFDNFVWSSYGTPWLQLSAEGKIDALSLEACRAFSLSIFGKHHHQPDIEVSGAIHYDKAVRALSSRLSSVGAPGSEELIIPIMILLMQSVCQEPALSRIVCLANVQAVNHARPSSRGLPSPRPTQTDTDLRASEILH